MNENNIQKIKEILVFYYIKKIDVFKNLKKIYSRTSVIRTNWDCT